MIVWIIAAALLAGIAGFWAGMLVMKDQTSYSRVKEFHKKFGHPAPEKATLIDDGREKLRVELIREELFEYQTALAKRDLVAVADALGDLDYVVNGAAIEHGIYLPGITAEIHRSNMTKLGPDGKPIYREDGKILKGDGYEPPRLEPILGL
jgi:predicted HAD superfamily Cof-like phosphohydrolase